MGLTGTMMGGIYHLDNGEMNVNDEYNDSLKQLLVYSKAKL